jgi:hypothetical protein
MAWSMVMKIKQYCIVGRNQISLLADEVNQLIAKGWQPLGPMRGCGVYSEHSYTQVMVKHEEKEGDQKYSRFLENMDRESYQALVTLWKKGYKREDIELALSQLQSWDDHSPREGE